MASRSSGKSATTKEATVKEKSEKKRRSKSELVDRAIKNIEEKLEANEVKATFGDFIRLLQLQKELQADQPREVKVTWIEAIEKESASEE